MIHADLEHADIRHRAAAPPATAARPSDCCRTRPRHGCGPARCRRRRRISLVVVLPALPVTATILALLRARAARARSSSPRWVLATVSSGPSRRRRACATPAPRRPWRRRRRATKSWPSRLSPFSATNRSPSFRVRVSMESPFTAKARAGLAQGGAFGFGGGPQRSCRAPSRSDAPPSPLPRGRRKGRTSPPTYWPVSWPLPAITSTSPSSSAAMAASDRLCAVADLARAVGARPGFRCGWRRDLRCGDCRR